MILEAFLICLLALVLLVSVLRRGRLIFWLWDGVVVCIFNFSTCNALESAPQARPQATGHE